MSVERSIHMLIGISLPISAPTIHIQSFSRIKSIGQIRKADGVLMTEMNTPMIQFTQQYDRYISNAANHIIFTAYRSLIAVIFRGSCVPMYSSPSTKGTSIPALALLICG